MHIGRAPSAQIRLVEADAAWEHCTALTQSGVRKQFSQAISALIGSCPGPDRPSAERLPQRHQRWLGVIGKRWATGRGYFQGRRLQPT